MERLMKRGGETTKIKRKIMNIMLLSKQIKIYCFFLQAPRFVLFSVITVINDVGASRSALISSVELCGFQMQNTKKLSRF